MSKVRKRAKIVNSETLLGTVDVSKSKCTGYFRCPDGSEQKPFEFENTRAGFEKFRDTYLWWQRRHHLNRVVIGFEPTGPYAEPLIHYLKSLKDQAVELVQVNPVHTKMLKEVHDNSPGKTDNKDPKVMADLIELGRILKVVVPEGTAADLRHLIHARERSLESKTRHVNQLQDLVYKIFPEFHRVFKNFQTKSVKYLLTHFITAQKIAEADVDELARILRKISRGRFQKAHAEQLVRAAKQTVGIAEGVAAIVTEIKHLVKMIEQHQNYIQDVEKQLCEKLALIPYSRYMLSLKGIGAVTVAGLIGEFANLNAFTIQSEVLKFAGLDLFEISSGSHRGLRRISKRGRSLIRKLLFFASLNVVRHNEVFRQKYELYLKRGMLKMKALIAIARKLLVVLFALVRDQVEFDEDYFRYTNMKKAA